MDGYHTIPPTCAGFVLSQCLFPTGSQGQRSCTHHLLCVRGCSIPTLQATSPMTKGDVLLSICQYCLQPGVSGSCQQARAIFMLQGTVLGRIKVPCII